MGWSASEKPALWREDKNGGSELQLPLTSQKDEDELRRVEKELKELHPHISEVKSVEAEYILFRVENVLEFCSHMVMHVQAEHRKRGPNNYVRLTVGSEDVNDSFINNLRPALQLPALA